MKTILITIFSGASAMAATTWDPADDNIVGSDFLGIETFDLQVSETSGPASGDGFDLSVNSTGGPIDLSIQSGSAARFAVTIPAGSTGVTSVELFVAFDRMAFPLNPLGPPDNGGSGSEIQALAYLRHLGGNDITGDITFQGVTTAPDSPQLTFTNNNNNTAFNSFDSGAGTANFTLDPLPEMIPGTTNNTPGFLRYSGIHSFVEGSSAPAHTGFTLVITPEGGGAFTPGTSFLTTFDAGIVPEPSGSTLALLGFASLVFLRRRA